MMQLCLEDVCVKESSSIAQKDLVDCNGAYPVYGASGFIKNINFYMQKEPYIAIVKDGAGVGRVMKLPAESSVIGTIQYIIPKENVDIDYLAYALEHMNLAKHFTGATIPHIYFKDYCKEKLPLHSLSEQQQMSKILNKTTDIISLRKQQLTKLDELVKSRFIEMFGEPVANPMRWPQTTIGDVAEIRIGPFGTLLHKEDYIEYGHALVNPSHIVDGKICIDPKQTTTNEKYDELTAYKLQIGDIVLGRRGEMGRCAVVYEDGLLCGTGSMIIRSRQQIKPYFLHTILSSPTYKKVIEDKAVGVTMMNLNVPLVASLKIPLLPLDLQVKFISILEQVDKSKLEIQKSLEMLETLKRALMQQYFG